MKKILSSVLLAIASISQAQQPAFNQAPPPPNLMAAPTIAPGMVQQQSAPGRNRVVSADTVGYGWQPADSYVTEEKLEKAKNSLSAMNSGGKFNSSYEWSKSRCMLNLAEHTYREVRTDGSTEYLYQTARLLAFAARDGQTVSFRTPQIPGYSRSNTELWSELQGLESQQGARCALPVLACASVALLGADYEFGQNYGPYKDHGQMMLGQYRDLISSAKSQISACPVSAPQPPPAPPKPVIYTAQAKALFAFDKSDIGSLQPNGNAVLKQLSNDMLQRFVSIQKIEVLGFTDRFGSEKYNQNLSNQRAINVAKFINGDVRQRFPASQITAKGMNSSNPVVTCPGPQKKSVIDCLEPNRRVEIFVTGETNPQFNTNTRLNGVEVKQY